jgi:hypothetical protein
LPVFCFVVCGIAVKSSYWIKFGATRWRPNIQVIGRPKLDVWSWIEEMTGALLSTLWLLKSPPMLYL